MKTKNFIMPIMAIAMAIGLAFSTKANVQSAGWVERNGQPYQLQNDPCSSGTSDACKVVFSDDLGNVHQVFTDISMETPKTGGTSDGDPYIIED